MKYSYSRIERFAQNEVIIREGEVSDDIYVIRHGKADVYRKNEIGEQILVGQLERGGVFGEMDFILEEPRTITVKARTEIEVEIINPRLFSELYDLEIGRMIRPIIQSMAERLRFLTMRITELEAQEVEPEISIQPESTDFSVIMEPLTPKALEAMNGAERIEINDFPLYVGRYTRRRSDDMFHANNLFLYDEMPYTISRSHFSVVRLNDEFYFYDRGSTLGSFVNGQQIGGDHESPKKIKLKDGVNEVVLGHQDGQLSYRLTTFHGIHPSSESSFQ